MNLGIIFGNGIWDWVLREFGNGEGGRNFACPALSHNPPEHPIAIIPQPKSPRREGPWEYNSHGAGRPGMGLHILDYLGGALAGFTGIPLSVVFVWS